MKFVVGAITAVAGRGLGGMNSNKASLPTEHQSQLDGNTAVSDPLSLELGDKNNLLVTTCFTIYRPFIELNKTSQSIQ